MDNLSRDILVYYYSYVARLVARDIFDHISCSSTFSTIDDNDCDDGDTHFHNHHHNTTFTSTHRHTGCNIGSNNIPDITTSTLRRQPTSRHDNTPRGYYLRKTNRSRTDRTKDVRDMPTTAHGTRVGGRTAENSEFARFLRETRLDIYRRHESEIAANYRRHNDTLHLAWYRQNAHMLLAQRRQIHANMRLERRYRRERVRRMVRMHRDARNKERLLQMPNRILKVVRPNSWFRERGFDPDCDSEPEPPRRPRRRNRQKRRRKAAKAKQMAAGD